ncbi:MAG: hypothetical protein ACK4I8_10475, partial [Armatimonadota bacterium]
MAVLQGCVFQCIDVNTNYRRGFSPELMVAMFVATKVAPKKFGSLEGRALARPKNSAHLEVRP